MSDLAPGAFRTLVLQLIELLDEAGDRIESRADELSSCMQEILALPGLDERVVNPTAGPDQLAQLGWLYQDGDVRITRGTVPAGFAQAPHNHGAWNIFGVYEGAAQYTSYRRLDDGSTPYRSQLEVAEDRIMTAGDVSILPEPPHDIHAVIGLAPQTTTLLVARGDFARTRQHHLPERGCYVELEGDASSHQLWS